MVRKTFTFILLLGAFVCSYAQLAIGEWQTMMAYDKSQSSVFFGDKVYAVSSGSLFSYSVEDGELLTYDLVGELSDVTVTHIALNRTQKRLLIVYDNGNIDLMDERGEVYNMTDLKNSSLTDKTVVGITMNGKYAYMFTTFGVVVLNVADAEITATYNFGNRVNACAVLNERIYVAFEKGGLYVGQKSDNLLDVSNWKVLSNETFSSLLNFKNELWASLAGGSLGTVNSENGEVKRILDGSFSYVDVVNDCLYAYRKDGVLYRFESSEKRETVVCDPGLLHISFGNNTYWISSSQQKLAGYQLADGKLEMSVQPLSLNAPKHNLFYQMFMHEGKLYTCGGGLFLIPYYNPGCIQVYDPENGWTVYQDEDVAELAGARAYRDVASIAVDPFDPNHLFAASSGYGVYEFQDGKYVKLYTPANSSVSPDYRYPNVIYPNGAKYDAKGNLWILCAGGTDAITIYTHDKRWISLYYENFSQKETLRGTFFDSRGWMWAVTPHHVYNGVFMLNTNGTLEETADDKSLFMNEFSNQDGTTLEEVVYCAVEDKDGAIWLGTSCGPWVISNPMALMESQKSHITVTQVKVPRNDGTNYADFLLDGVVVSTIAVDGANRKWIGTEKNGIYLVSADGMEEIHHFTTENSPLLSNEVQSIAIDDKTGLVYIGTAKGLVAYQSDATEAQNEFSESNVRAYPNPVHPDYTGYITITGLMMNSTVKITDSYGSLVHEGTSVGGSYSWNGQNVRGRRVASGVYHVLASDESGKEGIVTKIVMIK